MNWGQWRSVIIDIWMFLLSYNKFIKIRAAIAAFNVRALMGRQETAIVYTTWECWKNTQIQVYH